MLLPFTSFSNSLNVSDEHQSGVGVLREVIQQLAKRLIDHHTTKGIDGRYVFRPKHPQGRSIPAANREHQQIAFIFGAVLSLHLLWVGHFPVAYSRAHILCMLYEGNMECLTIDFLEEHAPEAVNIILIWRKAPHLRTTDDRMCLLTTFSTFFGQAVCLSCRIYISSCISSNTDGLLTEYAFY
jgi:hypothetical protein